jgi:hypothetical protein
MPNQGSRFKTASEQDDQVKRIKREAKQLTEESFIVPSQDREGRSYPVTFNVPPFLYREIEEILYSRKFPFSTRGDVLRWALFWGLARLEEYKPGKMGFIVWAKIEKQKYQDELYLGAHRDCGDMLDKAMEMYLKDGTEVGKLRAYAVLKEAYDNAMKIKQPFWRKKRRQEIRDKYGKMLANPPKVTRVSLDPENWDDEETETDDGTEGAGNVKSN